MTVLGHDPCFATKHFTDLVHHFIFIFVNLNAFCDLFYNVVVNSADLSPRLLCIFSY